MIVDFYRNVFVSSKINYIIITSYNLASNMIHDFANLGKWDYTILDEGHVIKNVQTNLYESMLMLKSNHKLVLTGNKNLLFKINSYYSHS